MKHSPINIPALLVCSILGAGACRDTTEAGSPPQQIVLDLSRLVGGAIAPPDFVSVLDSTRLRVAAGGQETSQVLPLGQSDSTVKFDVTVPSGSVRFRLDVFSNNLTPLYAADTTVSVNADNFAVHIRPDAVNGVLVVWPRNPPYDSTFLFRRRVKVASWMLRNAGLSPLQWSIDTLASDGVFACLVHGQLEDCSTLRTLTPSPLPDTILVAFDSIAPGTDRIISFTSNVGHATFATGIP